ncbi:M23 family metallopeptidase [Aquitalea sp. ASV15]|uniref:M23 family metallopeptidase n=1 Tax=Aquitalea sp. ASV15 TaxID=2795104 RepID=UPI0018EA5D49|nr:M23 family metallopeptidase [Aquitalea sp. ASV15]
MNISPPTLKQAQHEMPDSEWLNALLPSTTLGGYPVTSQFEWHGGMHVQLSGSGEQNNVRAIANGYVIHYRDCGPGELNPDEDSPLRRNGLDTPGCVVMRHETEIGSGRDGYVVFYSVYQNLGKLSPEVMIAFQQGKILARKQIIGKAGYTGGMSGFHFEIFCNTENLRRLTGRTSGKLDLSKNGRENIIFGDSHFYIPQGTPYYSGDKAPKGQSKPAGTTTQDLYVTMEIGHRTATLTTRILQNGTFITVPNKITPPYWKNYDINLYRMTKDIGKQVPEASQSTIYEYLRYGRLISKSHNRELPAHANIYQQITTPQGLFWINIRDEKIKKYSDADFPHWLGWHFVDDDKTRDGLCHSAYIQQLLLPKEQEKTRQKLIAAFSAKTNTLSRLICQFKSEWDGTKIDERYGWMKKESYLNPKSEVMSDKAFDLLKEKIKILCFWEKIKNRTGVMTQKMYYPNEESHYDRSLDDNIWHFHPREFIQTFRKCKWFGSFEMENIFIPAIDKSRPEITPQYLIARYKNAINQTVSKYGFDIGWQTIHFFGQGCVECAQLSNMTEIAQYQDYINKKGLAPVEESLQSHEIKIEHWWGREANEKTEYYARERYNSKGKLIASGYNWRNGNLDGDDAQKFRGRGFKQLTGLENYSKYWIFRAWLDKTLFDENWTNDPAYLTRNKSKMKMKPPNIENPELLSINTYNCIDSGGFYLSCIRQEAKLTMTHIDKSTIKIITKKINGGDIGLLDRESHTYRINYVIGDEIEMPESFLPVKYANRFGFAFKIKI